jgi:hypothetical protein
VLCEHERPVEQGAETEDDHGIALEDLRHSSNLDLVIPPTDGNRPKRVSRETSALETCIGDLATVEMSHRRIWLTEASFSELLERFLLPHEVHALHDEPITRG